VRLVLVDAAEIGDEAPVFQMTSQPLLGDLLLNITNSATMRMLMSDAYEQKQVVTPELVDQYTQFLWRPCTPDNAGAHAGLRRGSDRTPSATAALTLTLLEAGGVHGNSVVTSRSTDGGFTWESPPVRTATGGDLDKNWIVCDNTASSPFYGNCYTQWDDHGAGNRLEMSRSTDGGLTWSAPATNNSGVIGGQPVVHPNGNVIVPIANANETAIGAFNSTNGGVSWRAVTTIATIQHRAVGGSLREGPLPSAGN
jgi:hypothetical protein